MRTRCGVVGSPIAHSLSPVLHRAAYAELGLDWSFDAHEVPAGALARFCAGLGPQWRGLAVTMPLKAEALALAPVAAPGAVAAGGANTLVRAVGGTGGGAGWAADNTDVAGIRAALGEALRHAGSVGRVRVAAVLGGGATARSAVVALAALADRVEVYVRSPGRRPGLVDSASAAGVAIAPRGWEERADAWGADLVVATTPAGVLDGDAAALPTTVRGLLLDVVYAPWPTALAAAWASRAPVVGGLDLLVHQAAAQVRLMTGREVGLPVLWAAGQAALHDRARA